MSLRLLDRRRIGRWFRWHWERIRPFTLPRYLPGTPKVETGDHPELYVPPTALTLADAALSEEAARAVSCVFDRLTPCEDLAVKQLFYSSARTKFRGHWRYADLATLLWAAATYVQPRSYLEIGVRRGWSAAVVGSVCPGCAVYGFDLWVPDYHGAPNPGPGFVRSELRSAGHVGELVLISGDSYTTLPALLAERPDLYFDLITIDGDKSVRGAASDFANVLPRLRVGGIVVFDDMPLEPALRRIWKRVIERDGRYVAWEFRDAGSGVAAAIRVSDEAPVPSLREG